MPRSGRTCGIQIPFENSELRIAALNHKPMSRIVGYRSADLTTEFPKKGHKFLIALLGEGGALGGSLFQFPALPLGLNAFGGSLFAVVLRMNAKIMP